MSFFDDLDPIRQNLPKDAESLSVEALEEYIGRLESEISRIRTLIASKQSSKTDAESLFRK